MSAPRLKTEIWVKALIRRAMSEGAFAVVANHGDDTSGSVLVKVATLDGQAIVLSSIRRGDGEGMWMRATGADPVPEGEADAYIAKTLGFDPDLWVIEIEDREGRHFLLDPVEGPGPGLGEEGN